MAIQYRLTGMQKERSMDSRQEMQDNHSTATKADDARLLKALF